MLSNSAERVQAEQAYVHFFLRGISYKGQSVSLVIRPYLGVISGQYSAYAMTKELGNLDVAASANSFYDVVTDRSLGRL